MAITACVLHTLIETDLGKTECISQQLIVHVLNHRLQSVHSQRLPSSVAV